MSYPRSLPQRVKRIAVDRSAWTLRVLRRHGIRGALSLLTRRVLTARSVLRARIAEKDFDRRHGIETRKVVHLERLDISSEHKGAGAKYEASSPERFAALVGALTIPFDQFAFVDYGSGKGRVLVMALDFPFAEIVGVEFARDLHEVALENIRRLDPVLPKSRSVTSICADATEYELPAMPLVAYFFNPFDRQVMRAVLARAVESIARASRPMFLVVSGGSEIADEAEAHGFVRLHPPALALPVRGAPALFAAPRGPGGPS